MAIYKFSNWYRFLPVVFLSLVYVSHCSLDKSLMPERCRHGKAIEANYTPKGDHYNLGNLTIYESPTRTPKRVLIAIYDIFGFSTNIKQVVDELARMYDFRVVLPDVFRGAELPDNFDELEEWVEKHGSWDNRVKYDLLNIIRHFQSTENITDFGIWGTCYGGLISTHAATELFPEIKAAALVHPSWVNISDARSVQAPIFVMPASDDPDFLPFYDILKQNFGYNCGHRRFNDMRHGFSSATGNFSDKLNAQRVEQVIDIMGIFFNYNVHELS